MCYLEVYTIVLASNVEYHARGLQDTCVCARACVSAVWCKQTAAVEIVDKKRDDRENGVTDVSGPSHRGLLTISGHDPSTIAPRHSETGNTRSQIETAANVHLNFRVMSYMRMYLLADSVDVGQSV